MFTVKSHNPNKQNKVDFFVISHGNNAGKPVKKATANCFEVVVTDTEVLLPEYLYYMVLNAHNQGAFKPFIRGSVIPFITIDDFYKAFALFYGSPP